MAFTENAAKIENFVAQTVLLIYNVARSSALLLRSPVRGSMRLLVRSRSQTLPQTGPYTLLFLTICTLLFIGQTSNELGKAFQQLIVDRNTPGALLAQAFITVVLFDGVLRVIGRITVGTDRRRRERFQNTALYALCAQGLYLMVILLMTRLGVRG